MEIDSIINNLCDDAQPVRCSGRPSLTLLLGLSSVAIYAFAFLALSGYRVDVAEKIAYAPYMFEVFFALLTMFTSIYAAAWQAYPDLSEHKLVSWLPAIPLAGFACAFAFGYIVQPGGDVDMHHGMQCAMHMCLISLLPTILLYYVLARGIFLHVGQASLYTGMAAAMTSYLVARLAEQTDDMLHLLIWHIVPLFMLTLVISLLNRWLMRKKRV